MLEWKSNIIFKQPFLSIGSWNLMSIRSFHHTDYVSADTETKLYLDNELLTEEHAYQLYKGKGADWCRTHIEVRAYAFMLSDGENFALFQNIEDFITCCSYMMVKRVFWYNARFDFALFDYYFATNGWILSNEKVKEFHHQKHKLPSRTYQDMCGDYGQRYQLRLWFEYKNHKGTRHTHCFKMVDICNIYGGGLRKNLEDWKIVDKDNKSVRKLHMDYVNASIEDDLEYMIADTKGLHLLAIKINQTIKELSGFSLFDGDFITAGGLAKKSFLKFCFHKDKPNENVELFHKFFPMSADLDKEFRSNNLYHGGKCFVSPYYVNKVVHNVYKFDVNSMYPTQMREMKYPVGEGVEVDKVSDDPHKVYVYLLRNVAGVLKKNMIPIWYDTMTNEYVGTFVEAEEHYLWREELEEYLEYYNMSYEVVKILEYDAYKFKGAMAYVDNYYKIKKESKGAIREGAKLFLNSAYGKLAQRLETQKCWYELAPDGYIHLCKGELETDEKNMMSVLIGSRITALGAVSLFSYIRKICKGNPKKYFLYCDTDSVHALCPYDDTDPKTLGKMKFEGCFETAKYIAPKTYLLYKEIGKEYKDGECMFECHTKGVNTEVVKKKLQSCKTFEEALNYFRAGTTFRCLSSLNVKGGKALIYIDKMLLNPIFEKSPLADDEELC